MRVINHQLRFKAAIAFCCFILAMSVGARRATAAPEKKETYFFLVFSDPVPGREAEYNTWYDEQHAPDVTSIPGFVSSRRYILAEKQLRAVALLKPKYLIIYRIETSDPAAVRADIQSRGRSGATRMSSSITNVKMYTYREFRPEQKGIGGNPMDASPGPSNDYIQVVFGDAVAGMDEEFNHWYDTVHEPQLLAGPGFTRGERAVISEVQLAPTDEGIAQSKYLALFEIRTTDLASVFRANKGITPPVSAFDGKRTFGYTYRAIGPVYDGEAIRAARK